MGPSRCHQPGGISIPAPTLIPPSHSHLPRCIGGLGLGFDWRDHVVQAVASQEALGHHHAIVVVAVEVSSVGGSAGSGQEGTMPDGELAAGGREVQGSTGGGIAHAADRAGRRSRDAGGAGGLGVCVAGGSRDLREAAEGEKRDKVRERGSGTDGRAQNPPRKFESAQDSNLEQCVASRMCSPCSSFPEQLCQRSHSHPAPRFPWCSPGLLPPPSQSWGTQGDPSLLHTCVVLGS